MDNCGGITINHTFTKNSSNAFEYEFNTGKLDLSYNNFLIIGYELRTGYIHIYKCLNYQFEYSSNYWIWIIVLIIIIAVIVLALIIFILIRKKKGDNPETTEKNNTDELMNQSLKSY